MADTSSEQPGNGTADPTILPKVLIVEDDFLTQAVIAGFLRGMCSTDHARDAKSAVEMAKEKHYSAVLMDIHLGPGQNGVDVTREIREISGYERSPIVAVTGSTMPGEQERLLSSGLTHYVAKPFDREELIRVLAGALDSGR
jgi:two-component system, sensor histidine kinase SagS